MATAQLAIFPAWLTAVIRHEATLTNLMRRNDAAFANHNQHFNPSVSHNWIA
jgi:hypothetical protein